MIADSSPRVISITSGKGGVGKTSMATNIAISLQSKGNRVLLIDADLGLANIDIMLGIAPQYSLEDLYESRVSFPEVLVEGPLGLQVLPAASGVMNLINLSNDQKMVLLEAVDEMADFFDYVLIDTGAGISSNVLYFNAAAQEVLIVTNEEPTAMTDAYAVMKVLNKERRISRFKLLVNEVQTASAAKEVYRKLSTVSDQYLDIGIDYLGFVYLDDHIPQSVRMQTPFIQAFPGCPASRCIDTTVDRLMHDPRMSGPNGNVQFFMSRLLEQGGTQ